MVFASDPALLNIASPRVDPQDDGRSLLRFLLSKNPYCGASPLSADSVEILQTCKFQEMRLQASLPSLKIGARHRQKNQEFPHLTAGAR